MIWLLLVVSIALCCAAVRLRSQGLDIEILRDAVRGEQARAQHLWDEREAARGEVLVMTALLASRDAMLIEIRRQLTDEIRLAAERIDAK